MAVCGLGWPAEPFVARLLEGLAGSGVRLTLVTPVAPRSTWLAAHGVAWHPEPRGSGLTALVGQAARALDWRGALRAAVAGVAGRSDTLEGAVAAVEPDVIYVPWINTAVAHPGLFDVAPVVVSCRGSLISIAPWDPSRPELRAHLPGVFERSAAVHCVSHDMVREAARFGLRPAAATVITPAVPVERFEPPVSGHRPDVLRMLWVGTMMWRKDVEHALVALAQAIDLGARVSVRFVGDGPEMQRARFTMGELGLGGHVEFLGAIDPGEVASVMAESDVLLHTSTGEGISNAVLEAMASGLAVVSTNVGGMAEAIDHDVDGLLVEPRDTAGMAAALERLATDESVRERLGAAARGRVLRDFRLEDQVGRFADLLSTAGGAA